jgi:hypothetical protein
METVTRKWLRENRIQIRAFGGQITEEDLDSLPTPFATTLTAEGKSMVEAGEPVRFEIFINLRGIGWATCWTENYHDEDEQD